MTSNPTFSKTAAKKQVFFSETLYLLDHKLQVIGARTKNKNTARPRFFTPFPELCRLSPAEWEQLGRALKRWDTRAYLAHSNKGPVLFVTFFAAATGMVLAAVPHGEIADSLSRVGAFSDAMEARGVMLSPFLSAKRSEGTEQDYAVIDRWLSRVLLPEPLLDRETHLRGMEEPLEHAAALCGCQLRCNISNLGYGHLPAVDTSLLYGSSLAILLATRRLSRARSLELLAQHTPPHSPLLHYVITGNPKAALHELSAILETARWRGDLITVHPDPEGKHRILITTSPYVPAIEQQGIRTPIYDQLVQSALILELP